MIAYNEIKILVTHISFTNPNHNRFDFSVLALFLIKIKSSTMEYTAENARQPNTI